MYASICHRFRSLTASRTVNREAQGTVQGESEGKALGVNMKRTTIFVPESLERDLQLYAQREQKPVASVVREALAEYLATRLPTAALPSFTGIGQSGRTDTASRHEELLWRDPHTDAPPPSRVPSRRRSSARKRS
jgi:hypothetical protein